jgi:hypothetical protein
MYKIFKKCDVTYYNRESQIIAAKSNIVLLYIDKSLTGTVYRRQTLTVRVCLILLNIKLKVYILEMQMKLNSISHHFRMTVRAIVMTILLIMTIQT